MITKMELQGMHFHFVDFVDVLTPENHYQTQHNLSSSGFTQFVSVSPE